MSELHTDQNPYVKSVCNVYFIYGFWSVCKKLYVTSDFLVVIDFTSLSIDFGEWGEEDMAKVLCIQVFYLEKI